MIVPTATRLRPIFSRIEFSRSRSERRCAQRTAFVNEQRS